MSRPALLALPLAVALNANTAVAAGVSKAAQAQAAREARLDQIDDFRKRCGTRRVEDWLKDVVGDTAKSIAWSGGRCQLVNPQNPLDAGSGSCGQAVIAPPTIEVFFEKPVTGRPGAPFALRAVADTKDGTITRARPSPSR